MRRMRNILISLFILSFVSIFNNKMQTDIILNVNNMKSFYSLFYLWNESFDNAPLYKKLTSSE